MASTGRQTRENTLQARAFSKDYWRYTFDQFWTQVSGWPANGYGTPAATSGSTNYMGNAGSADSIYEYTLWSAQTILAPQFVAAKGLDVALDKVNAHGVEYVPGGSDGTYAKHKAVLGPPAATIPPTPADPNNNCIFRIKMSLATVANTIVCVLGWRKVQAYQQTSLATYTDYAALNMNAGTLNVNTQLASGGQVTTVSTETAANAAIFTMEVRIINLKAFYFFNGKPVAQPGPSFSFASGTTIIPFFLFLQAAGANTSCYWNSVEVGSYQSMVLDQRGDTGPGDRGGAAF